MKQLKTILIDDEDRGRTALRNAISRYCPELEIVAEGNNVASGLEAIRIHQPDLIFLDIEMPDGTGFDLLEKLSKHDFCLIFITAFDQYAMKAFRYSAIDYLQKPVDPDLLIEAVEKAIKEYDNKDFSNKVEVLLSNQAKVEKIIVPTSDGIRLLKIEDIIRCASDSNYTRFFLSNKEELLVSRTLKEYETMLEEHNFLRVHHSHLINLEHIDRYINRDGGSVLMTDGSQVLISRRKKDLLMEKLLNK